MFGLIADLLGLPPWEVLTGLVVAQRLRRLGDPNRGLINPQNLQYYLRRSSLKLNRAIRGLLKASARIAAFRKCCPIGDRLFMRAQVVCGELSGHVPELCPVRAADAPEHSDFLYPSEGLFLIILRRRRLTAYPALA